MLYNKKTYIICFVYQSMFSLTDSFSYVNSQYNFVMKVIFPGTKKVKRIVIWESNNKKVLEKNKNWVKST